MAEEDPLEKSVRLLDEALRTPSHPIRFNTSHKFSPYTTPNIMRLEEHEDSFSFDTDNLEKRRLRRSDILDLSITLEPGELSRICDVSGVMNEKSMINVEAGIDNLLSQFQSTFQTFGTTQSVFEAISSFIETCTNTIDTLYRTQYTAQDISWLVNERNTWRLIHALYRDRALKYDELQEAMTVDYSIERSEKELQEHFYKTNRIVREVQIVIDWLERIARDEWTILNRSEVGHYTDRTVAWENTLHSLQSGDRVLFRPSREIVSSLDPDAPRRQKKPLHDIDHEDDRRLLQHVFLEIRCGRLEKAEEHCLHCGQQWRAATLEGWRLHHDPNYSEHSIDGTKLPIEGNPHRDIWKLCAWQLCSDPYTPQEERAVMGALCGHLDSLLAEAGSWEDLLWAESRVYVDIKVEQEIRDNSLRNYVDMPKEYWNNQKTLEAIFSHVKAHDKGRAEGNRPDRTVQELIILNKVDELLNKCSTWAEGQCQVQFLRFLAHLVLVLRMLGKSEPMECGNNILAAYMKALVATQNPDLISYYASLLPEDKQIELFSDYMESVSDPDEKTIVLKSAEKYGLNIRAVTERTVQNIRNRQLEEERENKSLVQETTEEDMKKISALEWMVFYREQRVEAIWECNALVRVFIAEGKLPAARLAHNKIPDDSVSLIVSQFNIEVDHDLIVHWDKFPPKVNAALKEYLCYKAYLDAHDGFNHWFHQFHNTKPTEPTKPTNGDFTELMAYEHKNEKYKQELERWNIGMEHITRNVQTQLQNILVFPPNGWLVDDYNEDSSRSEQLLMLRDHCLPQVFLLLHKVLFSMEKLEESAKIFALIGREEFNLEKVFKAQVASDMVKVIEETTEALMIKSGNPFGHQCLLAPRKKPPPVPLDVLLKNFPSVPLAEGEGEMIEMPGKEDEEENKLETSLTEDEFGFIEEEVEDDDDVFVDCEEDSRESAAKSLMKFEPMNYQSGRKITYSSLKIQDSF
ncbi:unnamed protein product [Nezara viridula]|uniref:Nuclear pore complex protein n=1 Tax=Nezara viridula TaxID=85310 RepID=A0A9P0HMS3_NEZVI|nr:unnamed protein product [Nezara viridula]